ncbi:uncharacterized protein LOC123265075 [Cotesia glomerata]|uniref:uncharacterized protein LOC123265075 n=1 Tax=Cotesia glomerata TaxID=32391 RepID=UPI001D010C89|nr:uncharacterized protein LOC123265075 [Cotesia glomerata]
MTNPLSYQGHQFLLDIRHNVDGNQRYRCSQFNNIRRCPVKLWCLSNGRMLQIGEHNHLVQVQAPLHIRGRSRPRVPPGNRRVTHRQLLPQIPLTFEGLEGIFLTVQAADNFYQGHVKDNASMAYLFSNADCMRQLGEAAEWHIQMNFQCVPLIPQSSFLLTILLRREILGVPAFYAICNENTSKLFGLIWEWILQKILGIANNLKYIICDLDESILSSARLWLPFADRRGSWVNSARALTDKWRSLQLPNRDKPTSILLNLAWALPFVPKESLNEAIRILSDMLDANVHNVPNFSIFRQFLTTDLAPVATHVSIWDMPWKAVSFTETYHRKLLHHLGEEHSTVFHLITKLSTLIGIEFNCNWSPRARRGNYGNYFNETAIVLSNRLIGGQCSLLDYMKIIGFTRAEVRSTLDVAVDRQRYLYHNLSVYESRFDLLGGRDRIVPVPEPIDESAPLETGQGLPSEAEEPIAELVAETVEEPEVQPEARPGAAESFAQDEDYFRGEMQLFDEPDQAPWINSSTEHLIFNDQVAANFSVACLACRINQPKAAFSPCGHHCLCLECKFKIEAAAERDNAHRPSFTIPCFLCREASTSIIVIVQ